MDITLVFETKVDSSNLSEATKCRRSIKVMHRFCKPEKSERYRWAAPNKQVSFSGRTSGFQPEDESSIPSTCTI